MNNTFLKKALRYAYLHGWLYHRIDGIHRRRLDLIAKRGGPVRVAFMAMSVSMWRYQHLYELMCQDSRFAPTIILSPSIDYTLEQQERDVLGMREYFGQRQIKYIDWDASNPYDMKSDLDPDLVFYPQPSEHLLTPMHDCTQFYDRLICYYPYAFWTSTGKWSYDFHFHNLAWRLYYSTSLHLAEAQKIACNHGRNVRVVGYPNADDFLRSSHEDVWKPQLDGKRLKRIIWAPHYSILPVFGLVPRSNFLEMAEPMLELAHKHREELQIAFKPHPRLLTELYAHPDWGKQRTDAYYAEWENGSNTQLETGEFVDLFMTSDAMVHDSGSFAVEYHYSQQPVMFVSKDMDSILATQSDFGKLVYSLHYLGQSMNDVHAFISDTVLLGNDPMLNRRHDFFNRHLLPPNNKSVAQNTLDDLVQSLFGPES